MGVEWAGALLLLTLPFVASARSGRLGVGWQESVAFLAAFILYFLVIGAFLLWSLRPEAAVVAYARRPLGLAFLPMAGIAFGAPVIAGLILLQRWMQVPKPWALAGATAAWICGCALVRRFRGRTARAAADSPSAG
ncbi:hypothetical protein [Longimicrobium sp.]|uniref:hypothetical protein n=1 Tax=Longimicrobium sp. TaxID=2029185 RepID=UPI003B3A8867